ncbi:MAG: class I SAM-dependent methyltransferase [bacterium]
MKEPYYRDGKHYDNQHAHLTADIAFYVEQAQQFGQPVLELACGTGRITIPIARQGLEISGIDLSETMLARAKDKTGEAYPVTWHHGDMRTFDLGRKFNLIFLPFNSVAHLYDLQSIQACFASVRNHLADNGRFILDFFNPDLTILTRVDEAPRLVSKYPDPDSGNTVVITETHRYDKATQINHIIWRRTIGDKTLTEELNMRIFYPQELEALLLYNGLIIEDKYGDFDKSPFTSASPKQICVCRRTRPREAHS